MTKKQKFPFSGQTDRQAIIQTSNNRKGQREEPLKWSCILEAHSKPTGDYDRTGMFTESSNTLESSAHHSTQSTYAPERARDGR